MSEASSEYTDLLAGSYMVSYVYLASATCAVFDYLSTFESEVEVVWKRPKWNVVQMLFFLTRYVGVGVQIYTAAFNIKRLRGTSIETARCGHYYVAFGILSNVVLLCMQGIMIYRISSMYSHNKKVMITIVVAFIAEVTCNVTVYCLAARVAAKALEALPVVTSDTVLSDMTKLEMQLCSGSTYPSWMFTLWIPVFCFESLLFYFALSLGIKYHKGMGNLQTLSGHLPGSTRAPSLAYILFRDSITFPFIATSLCVVELLSYTSLSRDVSHAFFAIPILLTTILGSRLILNLREGYYRPYEEELETIPNDDHPLVFLSTPSDPHNILTTSSATVYNS
ncbi:hypothetical protein HYPSUDRAFT_39002 [Hypholoma sublateritium FD-334 SS-4]|uniref:DUF6533 domain-containing protein n=1 Tax=Hypholoma sublateritium (strain FD-334 SS-4) TaxID=945553 RepID=A0A0D2PXW3_HYPSF|nr:hypothetical protein HYPSUDRAFT_39002 [Hypholoma sublateritium FD-334 SS-4]